MRRVYFLALLLVPSVSYAYSYVLSYDTVSPNVQPPNVSESPGGSYDMHVETYTTGGSSCSATCKLRVYDAIQGSDSDTGGGKAVEGGRIKLWSWNGPAGTAPGYFARRSYSGSGNISTSGTAISARGTASSSTHGTSEGVGGATVSLVNVGGTCTQNATGSISGSVSITPSGVSGVSGSVEGGISGIGSYAKTGTWSIAITPAEESCSDSASYGVSWRHKCLPSFSATAYGYLLDAGKGYCQIDMTAAVTGSISVRLQPDTCP